MRLRPGDLRAFLDRPWDELRRSKELHWRKLGQRRGALALLRVGDDLRQHVQTLRPGWPSAADRAADLRHHLKLQRLLRRIARAWSAKRPR